MKETLVSLPSGSIDIVHIPQGTLLQFNASCMDAMPYCRGMCCGMRQLYNTKLSEEEANSGKYQVLRVKNNPTAFIAYDEKTKRCVHQGEDNLCQVHADKPHNCSIWHCSPDGVGDGITIRGTGWFLLPVVTNQDGLVRTVPE